MTQDNDTQSPEIETSTQLADFSPVPLRQRHDGWTAEKQIEFIEALAACGCVSDACRVVGMTDTSAYRLRNRPDAAAFRLAWRAALDAGVERLADAAFSRALHGVERPIFRGQERVGEYRHFDERLTMFLLRYRDPVRYGKYMDNMIAQQPPEARGIIYMRARGLLEDQLESGDADFAAHGFGLGGAYDEGQEEEED